MNQLVKRIDSQKREPRLRTDLHFQVAELKPATVQRMMTDCRTYWAYLDTIEEVPEDSAPFDRLGLKVKRSSWLPYTPKEAVRLLRAAEGDRQLADVIRMAMYTGARREELCSLKVEHVKGDRAAVGRQQPLLTLTKRSIEADIEPM